MTKNQARKLIQGELGLLLPSFTPASMGGFYRPIVDGKQRIGFSFIDRNPEFRFSLVIEITNIKVSCILNSLTGVKPNTESSAFMSRLDRFASRTEKYRFTTEDELRRCIPEISQIIQERLIPFLDQHRDLQSLHRAINIDIPSLDIAMQPYKGINGIILAKLVHSPDFETIVEKWQKEIPQSGMYRELFDKASAYLRRADFDIKLVS